MAFASELNFLTTLLPLVSIVFLIAIGVILLNQHFRKNLYQQMLAQEELKNLHQLGLLRSNIEAQEKERKRIAQDMHDELGAALSIVRMQLVQLEQQQRSNHDLSAALQRVRVTTEAVLTSMRRLSHELMPPQLEAFGLLKTLEAFRTQITDTRNITLHLTSNDEPSGLSKPVEVALYRICMEMIHNTLKHSGAKNIHIAITQNEMHTVLTYSDDGIGLRGNNYFQGLGFRNMEARANIMGGILQTGNGKNGGFYACLKIPV